MAWLLLKRTCMKMRTAVVKKPVSRHASRTAGTESLNLPRLFLFLELFVDRDIPQRSTK